MKIDLLIISGEHRKLFFLIFFAKHYLKAQLHKLEVTSLPHKWGYKIECRGWKKLAMLIRVRDRQKENAQIKYDEAEESHVTSEALAQNIRHEHFELHMLPHDATQ